MGAMLSRPLASQRTVGFLRGRESMPPPPGGHCTPLTRKREKPMPLLPPTFLFRVAHGCRYVKDMPRRDDDSLLDLPVECRLDDFAVMDGQKSFAEVRLAWNELGL